MVAGLLFWQTKDSPHFWNYTRRLMKYWEIIADNLSKARLERGCVSAIDCERRTIWIVDAHRLVRPFPLSLGFGLSELSYS